MDGKALRLLGVVAPTVYEVIQRAGAKRTDDQMLLVLGMQVELQRKTAEAVESLVDKIDEDHRIMKTSLDVLIERKNTH